MAAAASARPSPRRSLVLPCRFPQSGPRSCVRPLAHECRTEDERGVPVAETGSQRCNGKDSREKPRRLWPLPPLMLPIPRCRRCRRGRVLRIAAPGALRSPLARRLSAGTWRAGAARLSWSPAPGCMLIRCGGGVPRFLRPTAGAGAPTTPATTPRPLALARAQGRRRASPGVGSRPAGGARAASGQQVRSHRTEGKAPHPGEGAAMRPRGSGRARCVPCAVSGELNLPLLTCQLLFLT